MKNYRLAVFVFILISILNSCETGLFNDSSELREFETTKYYDSEIFPDSYLDIYGKWELYSISGGFAGDGYEPNFDYLEVKEFGIYGFIRNDSLIEYGKIAPASQTANDFSLKIDFVKDDLSDSFFTDTEKYVVFSGEDTLNLNSPCCDRFNYHFIRIK